jgi:hypothetical protein
MINVKLLYVLFSYLPRKEYEEKGTETINKSGETILKELKALRTYNYR